MRILAFGLAAALVLTVAAGAYFLFGGFSLLPPSTPAAWANFGSYLGGVAGPGLSFLALLAVIDALRLQRAQLEVEQQRQLSEQHIRWLDALYADIRETLSVSVPSSDGSRVSVRSVLDHEVDTAKLDKATLEGRLAELMTLLGQYCQAVALYRDNISPFFDVTIFADRGARILDKLKPFHRLLGTMSPISIEFCDMHLRGVRERAQPEAMKRSTR